MKKLVLGSLLLVLGCGDRDAAFDKAFRPQVDQNGAPLVAGMTGSLALLDSELNQVLMLTSPRPLELETTRLPVGRDVVQFETSPDRRRLFVLSRGVQPRYRESDEAPQLLVFDGGPAPRLLEEHELKDPYEQLELDPLGEWLIVHGSEGLVSNPNELILVHLEAGDGPLPSKTLDSYGGKPVRFTFTSELGAPGREPRRLLVVEREKDLAIIDLLNLDDAEITVPLPQRENGQFVSPAAVVFHAGIDGEVGSMLAVQLAGDTNVYLLTLGAAKNDRHAFSLETNLVDVGGVPSTIDFVQTERDGGLRLVALVPSRSAAMLVDPASGALQEVTLPQGFDRIRRITSDVSERSGQDIALLYGQTNTIAFWQLGATIGTPYRSIDDYQIGISVDTVLDVPGAEFADRKILTNAGASTKQFYVLNLSERKSFPLDVLTNLTLNLAPDGQRLWAFDPNTTRLAQLTFDPLQPASLYTQRAISYVHDVETQRESERSAIALHLLPGAQSNPTLAATVFDALDPRTDDSRFFTSLELGGIR
jgi:hypothetical protein